MDEKGKGGFRQDEIPHDFREATDETRRLLADAVKKDAAPLADLITSHADALKKWLTFLTKFYRRNRPIDPSGFRKFMRDEVDAVWYIHEIMDDDLTLIRDLESRLDASIPSAFKEEWQNTLNQVDAAIEGSFNVVRASLDGWDEGKTSEERSLGRQRAIKTLDDLAGQWSAIATKLTTIKKDYSETPSQPGEVPIPAPEDDAGPDNLSAAR
jgi:hypothetical protein